MLGLTAALAAPGSVIGYRSLRDRDLPLLPLRCGTAQTAVRDASAGMPPGTPAASWLLPQGPGETEASTPWSVAFGPDSRTVVVGGGAGRTLVWDLTTGRSTCTLTSPATHYTWEYGDTDTQVQTVAVPSPGTVLTRDVISRLWNTRTGRVRSTPGLPDDAVVSEDGSRAASVRDGRVEVSDVTGGDRVASWPASEDAMIGDLDRDGSLVATTVYALGSDVGVPPLEVHRVPGGDLVRAVPLPAGTTSLVALKLSADGRRLAAQITTAGRRLVVWDVATGAVVADLPQDDDLQALSPDGILAVLAGPDTTTVVEVATGTVRARMPASRGLSQHQAVFSPDGRSVAVILTHAVGVWPVG